MSANEFYSSGQQGQYNQQNNQERTGAPNNGQYGADNGNPNGERGLFSTIVGGSAGAYAGSKVSNNHSKLSGALGAIGGAFLANKISDERKEHKQQEQYGNSNFGGAPQGGHNNHHRQQSYDQP